MKLSDFDFDLPRELIARFPAERRDGSRLLVVERGSGRISHHRFSDLPGLLAAGDFLVMNNSRVIPVRLLGRINGRTAEMLAVKNLGDRRIEALCQPAARFKVGETFVMAGGPQARVMAGGERGHRLLLFDREFAEVLEHGCAPLPPYIKRKAQEASARRAFDLERYQTVYAREPGSIAAPTAGLHFTDEILETIRRRHEVLEITLDVGEATFQKIEREDIAETLAQTVQPQHQPAE